MPYPIKTIKESEDKAKDIIAQARVQAEKGLVSALKAKETEAEKVIENENKKAELSLKNIVDKIDELIREKEEQAGEAAKSMKKGAEKNIPAAVELKKNMLNS